MNKRNSRISLPQRGRWRRSRRMRRLPFVYCAHVLLIHRKRSPFPAGEGFFVQLYLLYRFFDSLRRATARSLFFYDFLDSFSTKPWKLNDDNGTWIIVIFIISKLFCQEKRFSRHFFLLFLHKNTPIRIRVFFIILPIFKKNNNKRKIANMILTAREKSGMIIDGKSRNSLQMNTKER